MLHIGNKSYNLGIQKGKILYIGGNKLGPIIPDEIPSAWYNWKTDTQINITSTLTTVPARCNIFYGGGKYLYIDTPYIYVSDDGINWVPTYNDTDNSLNGYECIVYGNNTYYVIGATVTIYSNDAENWSKTSTYSNMIVGWGSQNKQPQTKVAYYKGNVIINFEPFPSSLSTLMFPPNRVIILCT